MFLAFGKLLGSNGKLVFLHTANNTWDCRFFFFYVGFRAKEMSLELREFAAIAEDPGSVPSTHIRQLPETPVQENLTDFSDVRGHLHVTAHSHIQTHDFKFFFKLKSFLNMKRTSVIHCIRRKGSRVVG